ncbi:hypothetical protein K7X08_004037 [Anisodus acutangulus]|uniref:Uncharacterized protein n=1 Tax=Anisodus acutangulus TaxID=402998 RepID=A0A9Q1RJR0_9SOLA|nr:hypothetical protein K7X08_004037 [Anisodus acutangulus]
MARGSCTKSHHACSDLVAVDQDTPNLLGFESDVRYARKLTKSLENFNHLKSVALSCKDDKVIAIPKHMRKTLPPPLYGTRLHVKVNNVLNHSVMDVVDSLSWLSPQLGTLCLGNALDRRTIKFTYRDAADDVDEKPCCASLPWKCWWHELKKVKLQNFTCFELPKLRNYFLMSTYTPEIIEDPGCSFCTSSH